ncbi:MAG: VanZ family protein [Candidatus Limnocylindria bacterium]
MEGFVDWLAWVAAAGRPLAWIAVFVAVGAAVLARWRARHAPQAEAIDRSLRDGALALAVAVVVVLTIRPAVPEPGYDPLLLIPFQDVVDVTVDPDLRARAVVDVVGNLVVFVPLGAALAARFPRWSWRGVVAATAILAVAVEVTQLILDIGRTADVTDVLVDPIGALLGFVAWRRLTSAPRESIATT